MDDAESQKPQRPAAAVGADRQQRLAAALRENLRRRKLQMRAREASGDEDPAARTVQKADPR
jgi:hypothetical protein